MRCLLSSVILAAGFSGCETEPAPLCGDAAFWSERSAEWPLDAVWVGEEAMPLANAVDLLELPPRDSRDALASALVVAELNLAAGGPTDVLPLVYAGHSWVSTDDGDPAIEAEAEALAEALERSVCP